MQVRSLRRLKLCLLLQPIANAGPKLTDAKCFDHLVTDAMPPCMDYFPNGPNQVVRLGGIDHTTELTVEQRVARSIDRAADDRNAASRGLDERDTKAFPVTRHHVHVSQVIVGHLFGFGDMACEDNVVGEPMCSRFQFESSSVGPIANDKVAEIWQLPQ